MSKLYTTACCNHEYIGINHSPVLETGYCLHCGHHPEIEKLKDQLKEAREVINTVFNLVSHEKAWNQFAEIQKAHFNCFKYLEKYQEKES